MRPAHAGCVVHRPTKTYTGPVGEEIHWDPEATEYIRSRGDRYPDADGIEPDWTQEVMDDVDLHPQRQT